LKILLLSDGPPSKYYPAGLVLDQLCRFLPAGSLASYSIINRLLNISISQDLEYIPTKYTKQPRDSIVLPHLIPSLNGFSDFFSNLFHLALYIRNIPSYKLIENNIVEYGKRFKADCLWCTLEGQSTIRLAYSVAKKLGIPLLSHVFDPPTWELRVAGAHKISSFFLLSTFNKAIKHSQRCATASYPMARQYASDYGVKTVALLPSLDQKLAISPSTKLNNSPELVIGTAGQIYATDEWHSLISALNFSKWKIAGRNVRLRLLGSYTPQNQIKEPMCIEYLGWHTQADLIKILSEVDILYCSYWLNPIFETEARLSFPSKLTSYLAAGRPVFFHGPEYASPAVFLQENEAGFVCSSNDVTRIIDALTQLTLDTSLYSRLSQNGRSAFDKYLTLSTLREHFAEFLGINENELLKVCNR
jgi:glycosyltransferase involved in cell wall biosynthesis